MTPRAALDRIDGWQTASDGSVHLAARVRAVPEKGAANAALERLIADVLAIGRSQVRVVAGGTARLKTVDIETDRDEAAVRAALSAN